MDDLRNKKEKKGMCKHFPNDEVLATKIPWRKFSEYSKLREYCNSQLEIVSISFNQSVIQIDENFYMGSRKFSLSRVKKKMNGSQKVLPPRPPSLGEEPEQVENVIMGAANVTSA